MQHARMVQTGVKSLENRYFPCAGSVVYVDPDYETKVIVAQIHSHLCLYRGYKFRFGRLRPSSPYHPLPVDSKLPNRPTQPQ